MNKKDHAARRTRWLFFGLFVLLVGAEFLIGIYARDDFIRPFVGDVIVVIVLYALVRVCVPQKWYGLSAAVFVFAVLVEFSQKIPLADALGISNPFLRILMGTSFAWADILCYAVGCAITAPYDILLFRKRQK